MKEKRNDVFPTSIISRKSIRIFIAIDGVLLLIVAFVISYHYVMGISDANITTSSSAIQENQFIEHPNQEMSVNSDLEPTKIIFYVHMLLNQTIEEYKKENFTGAQDLATKAYIDNFELIEQTLERHDKILKENTEKLLREQLRQSIKDRLPLKNIQQLVGKINDNLDKATKLLSSSTSFVSTIRVVTSITRVANNAAITQIPTQLTAWDSYNISDPMDGKFMVNHPHHI